MSAREPDKSDRKQNLFGMTLALVLGQVGCLKLAILLLAVLIGFCLDGSVVNQLIELRQALI